MTLDELEQVIEAIADEVGGGGGMWQFSVNGVSMACFTDMNYDRMRVVAPIIDTDDFTPEQKDAALEANFHSALDARYGVSNGVVYAAYIHPLSPLTAREMSAAVAQVASLVETFGSTFSGGHLFFGPSSDPEDMN